MDYQIKKKHTVGESLTKSCIYKKISEIPLSNDTVKPLIQEISYNVEEKIIDKIKNNPYFALQCDEFTDIKRCNKSIFRETLLCLVPVLVLQRG